MAITRRTHGAATAWTTSQPIPYSASATTGDVCYIVALNTVMPGAAPTGWTSIASGTANGYSMNIYKKDTTYTTGDAVPTITASGGAAGVAWIEHFYSSTGGMTVTEFTPQVALDTTTGSNAFSAVGTSVTSVTGEWLVGWMGLKSSATMTNNASSISLTQAGATVGTAVGNFGSRLSSASPTNSLYYNSYTRPITSGGTGAMSFSATGGNGSANVAGPAGLMRLREITPAVDATPVATEVVSITTVDAATVVADASTTVVTDVVPTATAIPLVAIPVMTTNNAEGGTSGNTVTIGNSGGASGTAFTDVNSGVTYTNAQVAHGALAYAFAGTAATFNTVTLTSPATGTIVGCAVRAYVYPTGYPSATTTFMALQTSAGVSMAGINLLSTGVVQVVESGGAFVGNFTTPLPLNEWTRIEIWIDGINAVTSIIDAAFYPGDSTTATESHQYTGRDTGSAPLGKVLYGKLTQAPGMTTYYLDDLAQNSNTAQAIGPVSSTDATPAPAAVVGVADVAVSTVVVSADASVTTTTVAGVAAVPSATVTVTSTATPTPATVVATTATDAPSVVAGADVSVPTSAVVGTSTVPDVLLPLDGAPTPDTVIGFASVWIMVGASGYLTDPTVAAAVAAVPGVTVDVVSNATPAPASVVSTATVPGATVTAEKFATVAPAAVTAVTAIAVPAVASESNAEATPTRVIAVSGVTDLIPDVTSTASVDVASVDAVGAVDAPAVQSGSSGTATPSEAAGAAAVPAVGVTADSNATVQPAEVNAVTSITDPSIVSASPADAFPAVVVATSTVPAPTVAAATNATPAPAVVIGTGDVAAVSVQAGTGAAPAPVVVDASVGVVPFPVVQVTVNSAATPALVTAVSDVAAPNVQTDANLSLSVGSVDGTAAVPTPSLSVNSNASPAVAAAVATAAVPLPTVLAYTDNSVNPPTVVAFSAVNPPLIGFEFNAPVPVSVIAAFAAVPTPFLNGLTGGMGKPVNNPHVELHRHHNGVVVHGNGNGVVMPAYA